MKKIGLLGGTFSPIHNGHIAIAEYAYKKYGLTEIWFIPSGVSYMKQGIAIPDGNHRMNMVRLAIHENPAFRADPIELERGGNSYTCDTLRELAQRYPDSRFYFIIGDDTLFSMETWYHPEEIFKMCTIITAVRDHTDPREIEQKAEALRETFGADILLMDSPVNQVSSTMIRDRIRNGRSIRAFVPPAVEQYIEENDLYQEADRQA